jgi:hypothetical protein
MNLLGLLFHRLKREQPQRAGGWKFSLPLSVPVGWQRLPPANKKGSRLWVFTLIARPLGPHLRHFEFGLILCTGHWRSLGMMRLNFQSASLIISRPLPCLICEKGRSTGPGEPVLGSPRLFSGQPSRRPLARLQRCGLVGSCGRIYSRPTAAGTELFPPKQTLDKPGRPRLTLP